MSKTTFEKLGIPYEETTHNNDNIAMVLDWY